MDYLDKIVARYIDSQNSSEEDQSDLINYLEKEKNKLKKDIRQYKSDLSIKNLILYKMSHSKQELSKDVNKLERTLGVEIEEIKIEGVDNEYNETEADNPDKNLLRLPVSPNNIRDQVLKSVAEIRILARELSKLEKVCNDTFGSLELDNGRLYSDKLYLEKLLEEKRQENPQENPRYNVVELATRRKKGQENER